MQTHLNHYPFGMPARLLLYFGLNALRGNFPNSEVAFCFDLCGVTSTMGCSGRRYSRQTRSASICPGTWSRSLPNVLAPVMLVGSRASSTWTHSLRELDLKPRPFTYFAADLFRHTLDQFRPEPDTRNPTHHADARGTQRPWHVLPWASIPSTTSGNVRKVSALLD